MNIEKVGGYYRIVADANTMLRKVWPLHDRGEHTTLYMSHLEGNKWVDEKQYKNYDDARVALIEAQEMIRCGLKDNQLEMVQT